MESRETAVHPTAVVMPGAELGSGVEVGPYCVIEPGVELGDGCRLSAFVHLLGRTTIGAGTTVGTGSVLGSEPQDRAFSGERTRVEIGSHCQIHEHVTVHRSTKEGKTSIGDRVMMMASSHVGHNATVENDVVMVNGAAVAGHGFVGERAFLSMGSAVHQFGRIGRLTLVGGGCMVTRDAPPFSIVVGNYPVVWRGPNSVGLKRAGFEDATRSAIRRSLFAIFRHPGGVIRGAEEHLDHSVKEVVELARFVLDSPRGVCAAPRNA
jgi:UDP-N-acetylglucosamine acyltransferase